MDEPLAPDFSRYITNNRINKHWTVKTNGIGLAHCCLRWFVRIVTWLQLIYPHTYSSTSVHTCWWLLGPLTNGKVAAGHFPVEVVALPIRPPQSQNLYPTIRIQLWRLYQIQQQFPKDSRTWGQEHWRSVIIRYMSWRKRDVLMKAANSCWWGCFRFIWSLVSSRTLKGLWNKPGAWMPSQHWRLFHFLKASWQHHHTTEITWVKSRGIVP